MHTEDVFDRQRDTHQLGRVFSFRNDFIGPLRLLKGFLLHDGQVGMDWIFDLFDALDESLGHLKRRHLLPHEHIGELMDR